MIGTLLLAAGGGALGAVCRGACTSFFKKRTPACFPFPTLIINITACFIIGMTIAAHLDDATVTFLCTGFLGGFSTLSTMNYEAVTYLVYRHYGKCLLYLLVSYGSALASTAAGFVAASSLLG